jgi:hypothetical protein
MSNHLTCAGFGRRTTGVTYRGRQRAPPTFNLWDLGRGDDPDRRGHVPRWFNQRTLR